MTIQMSNEGDSRLHNLAGYIPKKISLPVLMPKKKITSSE
jgi:hypothetical protein